MGEELGGWCSQVRGIGMVLGCGRQLEEDA